MTSPNIRDLLAEIAHGLQSLLPRLNRIFAELDAHGTPSPDRLYEQAKHVRDQVVTVIERVQLIEAVVRGGEADARTAVLGDVHRLPVDRPESD